MSMQLLVEAIQPEKRPLAPTKPTEEGGCWVLKGLCLQGEVTNHNGRSYPRDQIELAVNQLNQRIQERGPIAGEMDHPEGLNINFDRVSHLITEMHMEGNDGHGTLEIIDEGKGKIVGACLKRGMQVGVSSRGSGNIGHDGQVSDFDIVTIDLVCNPSAPNAFPAASLAESLDLSQYGREAVRLSELVKDDPSAQRYFDKQIDAFLMEIRDQITFRGK